jgi:hypothetical protein
MGKRHAPDLNHYPLNNETQTFPIVCSDGRTGIGTLRGDRAGGKVRFSDGTEGGFIIGAGASQI